MKKRKKLFASVLTACLFLVCFGLTAGAAESAEESLYEKSGAEEIYRSLGGETKDLLAKAGVDSALVSGEIRAESLLQAFSETFREKLTAPVKALAALLASAILCKLAACFDNGNSRTVIALTGALTCAAAVVTPLLRLLSSARSAVESASVFLLAAVPVYAALMAASGSAATGASYSFLALAAGNSIPVIASAVVFPMLHVFLALALVSAVSQQRFDRLSASLYGFGKWLLVLAVTAFSGFLSVQAALNAQVDAATNKAAKLVVSAAVPIVGSAFGDAVAAIQNSVHVVKSGVSAFGMLAALCIFVPTAVEASLWIGVCSLGQIIGDLFQIPKISSFLGMCASAARMILAVIVSTCVVCVVTTAIVLLVRANV